MRFRNPLYVADGRTLRLFHWRTRGVTRHTEPTLTGDYSAVNPAREYIQSREVSLEVDVVHDRPNAAMADIRGDHQLTF